MHWKITNIFKISPNRVKISNCLISAHRASQVAQVVKNPPAVQEIQVQSLGWEDLLEKGTHSIIVSWRIQRAEEPGGLQSVGSQRVGLDWVAKHS